MERIIALDWGAYLHFSNESAWHPNLLRFMKVGYYLGDTVSILALLGLAILFFVMQGKNRSALIALLTFGAAFLLIESVRILVPRPRPADAQNWLGPERMVGSYPAAGVFLFMLVMILIGFALWSGVRSPWTRGVFVLAATLLTVWVCMSQFFLATHFVTDVIGAIAGAAIFGLIASRWMVSNDSLPN